MRALQVEAVEIQAKLAELRLRRRRQARLRMLKRLALLIGACLAAGMLAAGFVYAGSSDRLADGERIAGVDVGGLTTREARRVLARREAALSRAPLVVRAGGHALSLRASDIGLRVDWQRAVEEARRQADGVGPLRGFRRMLVSLFGVEVTPPARADREALRRTLDRIAAAVDVPRREAAIRLDGLRPRVVPGRPGRVLDRRQAAAALVSAFASLERRPVALPLRSDPVRVGASSLAPVARRLRTVLSAPVVLTLGATSYRLSPAQLARLLLLPADGERRLRIGGPAADAYFRRLARQVARPGRDAQFLVLPGGKVEVVPHVDGRALDVARTAENVLRASLSPGRRVAPIVMTTKQPARTTAEARAMGIKELVSSYTTSYGGVPNRIHNVRLVARLIDNTLIPPGKTFSFNQATGARTPEKGFLEAPVIINGELQTALGGGVCQVSTTVFNAAYEAGLKISERTNHALYISHYPQGRDATVDYPSLDLKFVNDTGHWLLLRTFVTSSSLTVSLYGTDPGRKVVSETSPLRVTGPPPLVKIADPTLPRGKQVVVEAGSPALATSVHRRVYTKDGKLLYDDVWYSSYRGEKRVVRVGTKPLPKVEKGKAKEKGKARPTAIPADVRRAGGV
jgi:vancomycin resistance protein YoaR